MTEEKLSTLARLDYLYKMVAYIYGEQNVNRSPAATFSHFVEVCGMLTMRDRGKKREGGSFEDALCRALGWYFPLIARFRIASVEELIFRKFPYACPYCRLAPHEDGRCKLVRGTQATVDHEKLLAAYQENQYKRPVRLNDWQIMFQKIYPRTTMESSRSTIGLMEELGEFAEAIRVYDRHPKYLLGEAADTFSYLMGLANEYQLQVEMDGGQFSFEDEFLKRYPGLCPQCGFVVCVCPSVPDSTVGRMAKELDVFQNESIFVRDPEQFSVEGRSASLAAIDESGGYEGLAARFPFDRGDANKGLVLLCLKLAAALGPENQETADRLRSAAIRIGSKSTYPGSPARQFNEDTLLLALRSAWREAGEEIRTEISETEIAAHIGTMIGKIRVLFVGACPRGEDQLRINEECRVIREAIQLSRGRDLVDLTVLSAPTIDDLRRALLNGCFEVVHIAGHGDEASILLHGADGVPEEITMDGLRQLIDRHHSTRCVILNSCHSAADLAVPLGELTVAMDEQIVDAAAIEFSRGFYDAIGAGRDFRFAVDEGITAAKAKGLKTPKVAIKSRA